MPVYVRFHLSSSFCVSLLPSASDWLVIRWREAECDSAIIHVDVCCWPCDVPACCVCCRSLAISLSFSISLLLLQIYQLAYGASISRTAHREAVFVSQTHRACEFVEVICSAPLAASLPGSLSASRSAGSWPSVCHWRVAHTQLSLTFCSVKETGLFDVSLQKKIFF